MRLLLALLLVGCAGDNEFAYLYDPPAGASTPTLMGRWGGATNGNDTRWVLAPDSVVLSNRCGSIVVGVSVAAEVSATAIRILESANDTDSSCFVNAVPGVIAACSDDPFMPKNDCFVQAQKSLTFYENPVNSLALTKIDD